MPARTKQVPIERVHFSTHNRAEATEFINQMYIGHRPRFGHDRENTEFTVRSVAAGTLRSDLIRLSMNFEITTDPFDFLMPLVPTRGHVRVTTAGEELRAGAGDAFLYRVGVPITVSWHDLDVHALSLPLDRVGEVAGELTGIDPADLRFESMKPVSAAMNRYWRGVTNLAGRELMAPDSAMASPLIAEQMFRTAATALLSTFPNTTMTQAYLPGPGTIAPAALRRAVAFIDANAGRAITLTGIARAAGVGARALQYAFARHHGTSPLGYLRRVRLERAHRDLQAADSANGDTVAAIAARWGFGKPGRFATEYRKIYGRPPSHTLRT